MEGLAGERAPVDRLVERISGQVDGERGDILDGRKVGRDRAVNGVGAERGEGIGEIPARVGRECRIVGLSLRVASHDGDAVNSRRIGSSERLDTGDGLSLV